ncbi:MAG: putative membrane protein YfcA [Candidatus Azotimanducaceae bacterium]|jgi:uncharacterized membrane protein YfcA
MLDYNNLLFLLLVGLGAMVQTLTGFAMGLIIMGGVTAMGLASISDTAAVVSLVSLLNTSLALRRCYHLIDYSYVISLACAMLPAILLGVFIMSYLAEVYADGLRMLLGLVIVAAGTLLMLTPQPYAKASGILGKALAGVAGGLMGGMYGAGGAPLAYLMYRQPLPVNIVRASLLGLFAISTLVRTAVVGAAGQINHNVLSLSAMAMPLVIIVTLITVRLSHRVSDALVRRCAFVLLILLGVFLMSGSSRFQAFLNP